ncbi:Aste57867_8046 [Aphanomyces stellatus]|uniref:Aste57867_8046 protein n=1 Tax=Aphanomyces stellatus TaxID=120398 RepID=A0A485KJ83_9STRA|nr:hypothetical protein As57867_008016 [Aphanomyces stellatus]VFT84938.1 Aste57867_8046 [Aphanomyces stellatus]
MSRVLVLVIAVVAATAAATSLRAVSLNTLCVDDSFADGWGTVGEMARRDALVASGNYTDASARQFLSSTRFQRVAGFLRTLQTTHNALFLQEVDVPSVVDGGEHLLKYFAIESAGPWRVACMVAGSAEMEMILVNTDEIKVVTNASIDNGPVLGCSAQVFLGGHAKPITLMTVHMRASAIRNPATLNDTLQRFMDVMPQDTSTVIVGGDLNVHIPDLVDRFARLDNRSWDYRTAENTTGMMGFTTQHEANFVGAYDGFVTRNYDSSTTSFDRTELYLQGFMPKYLGNGTHGASAFQYADGPYPSIEGNLNFNHHDLGKRNWANGSLSDHVAVSSSFFNDDEGRVAFFYYLKLLGTLVSKLLFAASPNSN